jgi:integrase
MAKDLLTDRKIVGAKPKAKEYMMSDGDRLYLRVRPSGARAWLFVYETHGKQHRMSLGEYPTITLAQARMLAQDARALLAAGQDPLQARDADRNAARIADEKARTNTVKALAAEWIASALAARDDNGAGALRVLQKDVFPAIGDMPPDEVRREHIYAIIDKMKARGVTRAVNVVLAELRQMYRWAMMRDRVERDPTFGIEKRDAGGTEPPRQRVLLDDEIVFLYQRIEGAIDRRALLLFLLLLSTGNRIGETLQAEWREIDFNACLWHIPAAHRKGNHRRPAAPHIVPLSPFALAVLASVQGLSDSSPYLFPGKAGTWAEKVPTKLFTDRQTDPKTARRRGRLLSTDLLPAGGHWTPHDLRRTARTTLSRLGVSTAVAEAVIGHAAPTKIHATYDVWEYAKEKREALDALGEHLEMLLS